MERWQRIDSAPADVAASELRVCCAASRWIERMLARRPFGWADAARRAAREEWFSLSSEEWKQAFASHPRIGDVHALRDKFGAAPDDSAQEQAGVAGATDDVLNAFVAGNRDYEARFGYIFIVCATGKSAQQMLDSVRARLSNPPEVEIGIASEEHAKITDLRLAAVV
jgi:2-oxo-4-hydroxy-4-carboxy-5-ureidoimidazoline decarboxylase